MSGNNILLRAQGTNNIIFYNEFINKLETMN